MAMWKSLFFSILTKCTFLLIILFSIRTHFVIHALDKILFDNNSTIPEMRSALARGINVDMRNADGMTPLMIAARHGDIERAKFLIRNGADINARAPKWNNLTPLQFAVSYGDTPSSAQIAKLLVDNGAIIRVQGTDGDTVLHNSLHISDYDARMNLVSFLIKHGAQVNAQNNKGNTMLHDAVQIRDQDWIVMFRDQFFLLTDESIKNKKGFTPLEYALDFLFTDLAAKMEIKPPIVGMNLQKSVNTFEKSGLNLLMLAVIAGDKNLVEKVITVRGAKVNLRSQDDLQYTPLQLAMLQQDIPMIELLLKNNASISTQNASGQDAMQFIEWVSDANAREEILQLFVQAGGNINIQGRNGNTLLHRVVMRNDLDLGKFMVKTYGKIIIPDIKNNDYNTPMNRALQVNNKLMVTLLDSLIAMRQASK
jgi:ankyrin repeat protein